jgi:pimeloyl-ACP methyl ester carboxylesterase
MSVSIAEKYRQAWGFAASAGMPNAFPGNFDFQFAKTLGCAPDGGAALGECYETAHRITVDDFESYTVEWIRTSERVEEIAHGCLAGGHSVSAREAFLRACTYWRAAGFYLPHDDPRGEHTWHRQRECFQHAAALMDHPIEAVSIPYENGKTLPGYFLRPAGAELPRPTLICLGGGDTTGEELYFWGNGAAAVRRGYNALLVEIPGQRGAIYLDNDLVFRPDAEVPFRYICDWTDARAEIDSEKLGLVGHSFGGYFAPRAAAFEKRIKACIANPTLPAFIANLLGMLGLPVDQPYPRNVDQIIEQSDSLRRFILTSDFRWRMGLEDASIAEFFDAAETFNLWGLESQITCPFLSVTTEGDGRKTIEAHRFFELLTCDKAERVISEAEGGEAHCGINNSALKQQIEFDWLDTVFGL